MYNEEYSKIFITGRDGIASKIMHKTLERGLKDKYFQDVLEVGANKGEHLKHVKYQYNRYLMTDIVKRLDNTDLGKNVEFEVQDVCDLTCENNSFDHVVSTCVLQHVNEPENALLEILRVTRPGGIGRILLQNDTTPLFHLIRKHTTLRKAKKSNLLDQVEEFFAREHKNNFFSIIKLAEIHYKNHNFKTYSFPTRVYPFEIFRILEFRKSLVE